MAYMYARTFPSTAVLAPSMPDMMHWLAPLPPNPVKNSEPTETDWLTIPSYRAKLIILIKDFY